MGFSWCWRFESGWQQVTYNDLWLRLSPATHVDWLVLLFHCSCWQDNQDAHVIFQSETRVVKPRSILHDTLPWTRGCETPGGRLSRDVIGRLDFVCGGAKRVPFTLYIDVEIAGPSNGERKPHGANEVFMHAGDADGATWRRLILGRGAGGCRYRPEKALKLTISANWGVQCGLVEFLVSRSVGQISDAPANQEPASVCLHACLIAASSLLLPSDAESRCRESGPRATAGGSRNADKALSRFPLSLQEVLDTKYFM